VFDLSRQLLRFDLGAAGRGLTGISRWCGIVNPEESRAIFSISSSVDESPDDAGHGGSLGLKMAYGVFEVEPFFFQ
jgi:hypothetical protein